MLGKNERDGYLAVEKSAADRRLSCGRILGAPIMARRSSGWAYRGTLASKGECADIALSQRTAWRNRWGRFMEGVSCPLKRENFPESANGPGIFLLGRSVTQRRSGFIPDIRILPKAEFSGPIRVRISFSLEPPMKLSRSK